jgi:RHS repeat-associated protein
LDSYGRTISRAVGTGTAVNYTYVGTSEDLATDGTSSYAYGAAGVLATQTGSITKFALTDVHGDLVGTFSSASGTTSMSEEYWYSPFGEQQPLQGSAGMLGFQSDLTDASTGTIDMGTRNYIPSLGRFSSRDVLFGESNDPMSMNQFAYAEGSPITYNDPTGMGTGEPQDLDPTKSGEHAYNGYDGESSGSNDYGPYPNESGGSSNAPSVPWNCRALWRQPIFKQWEGLGGELPSGPDLQKWIELTQGLFDILGTFDKSDPTGSVWAEPAPDGGGEPYSGATYARLNMRGKSGNVTGYTLELSTVVEFHGGRGGYSGVTYELKVFDPTTGHYRLDYMSAGQHDFTPSGGSLGPPNGTELGDNGRGYFSTFARPLSSGIPIRMRTLVVGRPFAGGPPLWTIASHQFYGEVFSAAP